MLGEHHDLMNEFPDLKERIQQLCQKDGSFADKVKEHDALDKEIRKLEELGQPMEDLTFEEMKKRRIHLKDQLHSALRSQ